jgi:hypothetical protein
MKRFVMFAAVVVAAGGTLGCGMLFGGGGGGGFVMPATSPYMYATDFTDYKPGNWVRYKMEMAGNASEMWIKCVGDAGGKLWIQTGMSSGGQEWDHLLCVNPSDRKVSKAWFSGKDDKEWKKCDVNESPAPQPMGKECPACKKEHKAPEMKWGDGSHKCGDKDLACNKCDTTAYGCDGKEMTMMALYCKDVPRLYAMGMMSEHGGLAAMEASGSKTTLVGFGSDAKPKHELPKE